MVSQEIKKAGKAIVGGRKFLELGVKLVGLAQDIAQTEAADVIRIVMIRPEQSHVVEAEVVSGG